MDQEGQVSPGGTRQTQLDQDSRAVGIGNDLLGVYKVRQYGSPDHHSSKDPDINIYSHHVRNNQARYLHSTSVEVLFSAKLHTMKVASRRKKSYRGSVL
jgi:hypothetical protein